MCACVSGGECACGGVCAWVSMHTHRYAFLSLSSPGNPTDRTESLVKQHENSEKEAQSYNSVRIGTEHLLLAMLKDTDALGSKLIRTMSVNTGKLYGELMEAMGEEKDHVI